MEDRMSNKIQNEMDNKCIKRNKKIPTSCLTKTKLCDNI